jgi:hypothetical protein
VTSFFEVYPWAGEVELAELEDAKTMGRHKKLSPWFFYFWAVGSSSQFFGNTHFCLKGVLE